MKLIILILFFVSCSKSEPLIQEELLQVHLWITSADKDFNIEVVRFDSLNREQEREILIVRQRSGDFDTLQKTNIKYEPKPAYYQISYINDQGKIQFYSKFFFAQRSLPVVISRVELSSYYK